MIRFYAPDIESTGELPEGESAHCSRVLRLRSGERIEVVDGRGNLFECVIDDAHQRHTSVTVVSRSELTRHWTPRITLALAPTKNMDRMEWLVEKAVEIGVDRIVFLECERSVRRVVKRERVEKIMVSAVKQSLKATLPELVELVGFADFVAEDPSAVKFMGYCDERTERRDFAVGYDGTSDLTVLIGPEGDFSPGGGDGALARIYARDIRRDTTAHRDSGALRAVRGAYDYYSKNTKLSRWKTISRNIWNRARRATSSCLPARV